MASVYIVDNDDEIRSAGGRELAAAIVCDNEIQAMNAMERGEPAIILLHYAVRKRESAEFVELLKTANPAAEIVVIGEGQSEQEIVECIMAGANGYQAISSLARYVRKMVQVVVAGEAWISRKMVAAIIASWRKSAYCH